MLDWSHPYPLSVYWLLTGACVALLVVAWRTSISDRLRSFALFLPRAMVLALLLMVLLNPVRRREHRLPAQPGQVQFLVDASRSMSLEAPTSRAAQVQQAIADADRRLSQNNRPQIELFRFGATLAALPDLGQLQSTDDASRLADALERLPARFSREPPRAVVVFSDGAIDDANHLSESARVLADLRVPVHVFPVGSVQIRGDVGIDDLVIPARVDAGTKVPVRGVVRGSGYAGERVLLAVRPADKPQSEPLATLPVTLTEGPQPFELVVEANPDHGELVLDAPPLTGEVTDRNNRVPFRLAAARRKLRVIYMEGTGNNEYHWVHDALQEDKDIECLSLVADQQYSQRPRLQRVGDSQRGFPTTREELLQYDCVICSDISLGAYTKEQLDWVVELVAERGGGFAMVGGITSFGAGKWDQTVWDQLIPIDMAGGKLGQGWLYFDFHVRVPEEALPHPIWRILEDPVQSRRAIAMMPVFHGTNYMQRLKPAATALAYAVEPIPNVGVMPIFAAQPYGRGRTFAFAPDSTADWGRDFESKWGEGDNRYFRRFWRNLVRWLSENSVAGNQRVRVSTDRVIYRAGVPILLSASAFTESNAETIDYQLRAEVPLSPSVPKGVSRADASASVPLVPNASTKNYTAEIDPQSLAAVIDTAAGDSAALLTRTIDVIATHDGKEVGRAAARVQILPDLHELLHPQPQPETLHELARQTNGQVLHSGGELAALLQQLPECAGDALVSRQPLWDHGWLWMAIVGLLAIEWLLRREAGYG